MGKTINTCKSYNFGPARYWVPRCRIRHAKWKLQQLVQAWKDSYSESTVSSYVNDCTSCECN